MSDDRYTLAEIHVGGPGSLLAHERWTLTEPEAAEREEIERLIREAVARLNARRRHTEG